jgi:MYXO-CTERM domain-containing protein
VDRSGTTLDLPARPISDVTNMYLGNPAAASDGTNYLVVWDNEEQPPMASLGFAFVDGATGTPGPPGKLPFHVYAPTVAFAGSQYLAVWSSINNLLAPENVYGARFDRQGNLIDTTPFPITTTGGLLPPYNVKVVTDGTNFLAVWRSVSGLRAARIDKDGRVLDDPPLTIGAGAPITQLWPANVTFDGTSYLVVWNEDNGNVRGVHVGRDGTLPDATPLPIALRTTDTGYFAPAVVFDGTNLVFAWQRNVFDANSNATASVLMQAFTPALAPAGGGGVMNLCTNCPTMRPQVVGARGQALTAFIRRDMSFGYGLDRVRMLMLTETPPSPPDAGSDAPDGADASSDGPRADAPPDGLPPADATSGGDSSGADAADAATSNDVASDRMGTDTAPTDATVAVDTAADRPTTTTDAGDAGAITSPPVDSGCGCATGGSGGAGGNAPLAAIALASILVVGRRGRRRFTCS